MPFDLSEYEPVEKRIRDFWNDHPMGRIVTELLHHEDGHYIVMARIYRGDELRDNPPAATGLAEESVSQRGVNATSALENAETSAIGRGLASLGYAPKGKRPSREEMRKAKAVTEVDGAVPDSTGVGGRGVPKASVATVGAAPLRTGGTQPDGSKTEASGLSVAASALSEPVSAKLTGSDLVEEVGAASADGEDANAVKPPPPHEPVWRDSPKMKGWEFCSVPSADGGQCWVHPLRRKSAVSA